MKLKVTIDGKTYEVDVDAQDEDSSRSLGGYIPPFAPPSTVTVPSAPVAAPKAAAPVGGGNVDESKVCRSPIAGIVIKVNVQVGQQLQVNDLLMVLEAMKMETNVTAPDPGKVKSVDVQPGDAVQVGQILVQLE